jgi:16S rRNA A1518/A1519 N6-dimethyltransferase RsmA/KsgA/DIM1 with predicted DNA glycosylase/AP lyase activity
MLNIEIIHEFISSVNLCGSEINDNYHIISNLPYNSRLSLLRNTKAMNDMLVYINLQIFYY